MLNKEITLNSIEHFSFCPYQWWLIYVENEWSENLHTIQGNIVHSKVDDASFIESRGDLRIERSVPLYSDELGLYGIADLIEFNYKSSELKSVNIIEYKKGKPDENKNVQTFDGLQLYAQTVCAKKIYNCEVNGYIFYNSIKKRVKLKDEKFFADLLDKILLEMRNYLGNNKIPPKNKGKHCKACSLREICLPRLGD